MEFFTAVVNMVPNLVADLSPKDRADVTKIVVIVTGTVALGKYITDRYFDYLEGKPASEQSSHVAALDSSAAIALDSPAAA